MNNYENIILDSKELVTGIIYKITNITNNKIYIGQTLSHRKNHNRFRPFGHIGRFNDHISEALCNTKKNQCRYLNQSIRKYGKDTFIVEKIEECDVNILDEKEKYYINLYNSLYPNGYNLTIGGKSYYIKNIQADTNIGYISNNTNKQHSNVTKLKISKGIKNFYETFPDKKIDLITRAQEQHYQNKIKIGINYNIDENNLDQYISIRKNNVTVIFERKRNGKKVIFNISKNELLEDTIYRAKQYLIDVINQRNNFLRHLQIAGNP